MGSYESQGLWLHSGKRPFTSFVSFGREGELSRKFKVNFCCSFTLIDDIIHSEQNMTQPGGFRCEWGIMGIVGNCYYVCGIIMWKAASFYYVCGVNNLLKKKTNFGFPCTTWSSAGVWLTHSCWRPTLTVQFTLRSLCVKKDSLFSCLRDKHKVTKKDEERWFCTLQTVTSSARNTGPVLSKRNRTHTSL